MTRSKEIEQAAKDWVHNEPNGNFGMLVAFQKGARWADAHPHWISVEDELPKAINVTELVLTYSADKHIRLDRYMHYHHKWVNGSSEVTHWMHLPAPPSNSEIPNNSEKGDEG